MAWATMGDEAKLPFCDDNQRKFLNSKAWASNPPFMGPLEKNASTGHTPIRIALSGSSKKLDLENEPLSSGKSKKEKKCEKTEEAKVDSLRKSLMEKRKDRKSGITEGGCAKVVEGNGTANKAQSKEDCQEASEGKTKKGVDSEASDGKIRDENGYYQESSTAVNLDSGVENQNVRSQASVSKMDRDLSRRDRNADGYYHGSSGCESLKAVYETTKTQRLKQQRDNNASIEENEPSRCSESDDGEGWDFKRKSRISSDRVRNVVCNLIWC